MRMYQKMMKSVCVLVLMLAGALSVGAVPAHPRPVDIKQSDGSVLTVKLVGDEFHHYSATTDGYTVVQRSNGDYVYAVESGAQLVPSTVIAHNPQMRDATEQRMVSGLQKGLTDKISMAQGTRMRSNRDQLMAPAKTDYQHFRGLVVLIEYTDRSFTYGNDYFDDMMNQEDYTGYYSSEGYFVPCTGSARDYYFDNSMGVFDPQFDVIGPVQVNYSSTTPQGTSNCEDIFVSAIDQIDSSVDFSQYDGDGDGVVDMIYFIVAGYTANFSGNNSGYLWPHQYYMYYYTSSLYDGVYLGRYSCSGEIYGWEYYGYTDPDGIGTIVHEFSHALGLMDLYDTDYGTNGAANDPGDWDVMSGGSYLNESRTPAGFSIWERYRLGFAEPEQITEKRAGYTLEPVNTGNVGYWIQSPNENEFFMIENRQQTGWDTYLPGHGMLVTRVEYDEDRWWENTINIYSYHMLYQLLRAGNSSESSDSDPFPGTAGVTSLNNLTTPSLKTWSGLDCEYGLANITETDGIITFGVVNGDGTAPAHGYDLGDVNHDGSINISDVTMLIDYMLDNGNDVCPVCADINSDGTINIADLTALIDMMLS